MTEKRGRGRPRGSPNKNSIATAHKKLVVEGKKDPLDLLLEVVDDESQALDVRVDAANKALPYLRPKLSATHVESSTDKITHEEWLASLK